jgi:hypothetical protein
VSRSARAAAGLVAVVTFAGTTAAQANAAPVPVPVNGTVLGAVGDAGWLEAQIGRRLGMERVYVDWTVAQSAPRLRWDIADGRTPVLSIRTETAAGIPVSWARIASGAEDRAIRAQAAAIRSLGRPVLLALNHEVDLRPISGTAADYVAAYRHYVGLFRSLGVRNVSFLVILTSGAYTSGRAAAWYPGDAYVDWVGADGYNDNGCLSDSGRREWRSFAKIFSAFEAFAVAHGKPAVIAEYASTEDLSKPGRKAQWITNAAETMHDWPQLKAALYFNDPGQTAGCFWPLSSSASALQAFVATAQQPSFNLRPL